MFGCCGPTLSYTLHIMIIIVITWLQYIRNTYTQIVSTISSSASSPPPIPHSTMKLIFIYASAAAAAFSVVAPLEKKEREREPTAWRRKIGNSMRKLYGCWKVPCYSSQTHTLSLRFAIQPNYSNHFHAFSFRSLYEGNWVKMWFEKWIYIYVVYTHLQ